MMKRTRKLLAMFIMFIMVMGEMGSAVFAAGIDAEPDSLTLKEEAAELLAEPAEALADAEDVPDVETASATDGKADELADIDDTETIAGKDGAGLQVFVNGVDFSADSREGKFLGTDGIWYDSISAIPSSVKGYISYNNMYLTMKDYDLKGNYDPENNTTYADDKVPATNIEVRGTGLDLTILVIGDCSIEPYGNTGSTSSAICADGNLYIESTNNSSGKRQKGTLTIASNIKSGVSWDSCIYSGGNLTLSSPEEGYNKYFEGLTLKCDVKGTRSASAPAEICCVGNINVDDAHVEVAMGQYEHDSYGILTDGSLSVPKGDVTVTCETPATQSGAKYYGISADSDISFGEKTLVAVDCRPVDPNLSECYGIYTKGKLTASGDLESFLRDDNNANCAVYADGGIELNGTLITNPADGAISSDGKTIVDKNGNIAKKVDILKGELYDLWIGSTRVSSFNCDDLSAAVEGTGATAVYDPSTQTLTLNKVTGVKGVDPNKGAKIYSAFAFNLRGKGNTIENTTTDKEGLWVSASGGTMSIEGEFTFKGDGNGIYTPGCVLEVGGSDTKLIGVSKNNKMCGIYARGGFTLKDGSVIAEGKEGLVSLEKPIAIMGGKLIATGSECAIKANNSTINIDDSMAITEPEDGVVGKDGNNSVIKSGDHISHNVKIEKKPTYTVTFSLNGKPGTAPADENVISGLTVSKPYPDPATDEFSFTGWYTEAECTNLYDFDTP
ncbi:MAG: InlB B-repeat-containing protein, partial [Lachnospiraceae bacterium]|nr:InlB B-repeat-containing protein [Lachnospiraceae bacterium]